VSPFLFHSLSTRFPRRLKGSFGGTRVFAASRGAASLEKEKPVYIGLGTVVVIIVIVAVVMMLRRG